MVHALDDDAKAFDDDDDAAVADATTDVVLAFDDASALEAAWDIDAGLEVPSFDHCQDVHVRLVVVRVGMLVRVFADAEASS